MLYNLILKVLMDSFSYMFQSDSVKDVPDSELKESEVMVEGEE